jgi:pimeloyl-ACP methyl ester carboxylesterase
MTTLHANGIDLYYEVRGRGPTIVLLHGFADSGALWQAQVDALRDRYQIITMDMRGHARSESPADLGLYTQDQVVEDVRAIMDAAGAERAVVGGHSLGGYTSLRFYQRYPDRVRGLILSGTGPGYRKMSGARGWTTINEREAEKLAVRGMDTEFDARETRTGRHGGDVPIQHVVRGLVNIRRGVMRMPPLIECSEIEVSAIVLVGEADQPFRGASEYLAAKIPNVTGPVVVPGASHWASYDDPATWNAAVEEFLAKLPE